MQTKTFGLIVFIVAVIAAAGFYIANRQSPTELLTPSKSDLSSQSQLSPSDTPSQQPNQPESTPSMTDTANNQHRVTIKTRLGNIVFLTYDADAPKAVANFIALADKNFYDGIIFHRVITGFMIQGGDPTGTGRGGTGNKFADELDPAAESGKIGYVPGTVAMANAGPNTNDSQFFIMQGETPLQYNYTIFGHVIEGQEVVDKIASLPVDDADKPLTPIVMDSVTVEAVK